MTAGRQRPVIAIDGPAGAGKSTVASRVAAALGYTYIDTGAMYRAVGWACARAGISPDDPASGRIAREVRIEFVDDVVGAPLTVADGVDVTSAIRTQEMGDAASRVSVWPEVRAALLDRQREMGRDGGVVMEGRDVQTHVFPDAEVKVFLTASEEERARRRARDLEDRGLPVPPLENVVAAIRERDERDSGRATAPLAAAPDAVVIDSDSLTIDQVVERIVALARAAEGGGERAPSRR
jgi:cytidylate kinase